MPALRRRARQGRHSGQRRGAGPDTGKATPSSHAARPPRSSERRSARPPRRATPPHDHRKAGGCWRCGRIYMPLPSGLPFHALAPNKMSPKGDIPSLAASRDLRLRLAQIVLNHSLGVTKLLGIDTAEQPDVYVGELRAPRRSRRRRSRCANAPDLDLRSSLAPISLPPSRHGIWLAEESEDPDVGDRG